MMLPAKVMIWLVLVVGNGPALHVGNFSTLPACEAAAKQASFTNPSGEGRVPFGFVCVPASEPGSEPPR